MDPLKDALPTRLLTPCGATSTPVPPIAQASAMAVQNLLNPLPPGVPALRPGRDSLVEGAHPSPLLPTCAPPKLVVPTTPDGGRPKRWLAKGGASFLPQSPWHDLVVHSHQEYLLGLGFAAQDLKLLSDPKEAPQALTALAQEARALLQLGFAPAQLVRIAQAPQGAVTLSVMLWHASHLVAVGITLDQVCRLACEKDGAEALAAASSAWPALKSWSLEADDVLRLAAMGTGRQVLHGLLRKHRRLGTMGFQTSQPFVLGRSDDVVGMADRALTAALGLSALGLGADHFVSLGRGAHGIDLLTELHGVASKLEAIGFDRPTMRALLTNVDVEYSGETLLCFCKLIDMTQWDASSRVSLLQLCCDDLLRPGAVQHLPSLVFMGFAAKDIVAVVMARHQSAMLQEMLRYTPALLALGFAPGDVISVMMRHGSSALMKSLIKCCEAHRNLGLTHHDLIVVAAREDGCVRLSAIGRYGPHLVSHGYTPEQLTAIAAGVGGPRVLRKLHIAAPKLRICGVHGDKMVDIVNGGTADATLTQILDDVDALEHFGLDLLEIGRLVKATHWVQVLRSTRHNMYAFRRAGFYKKHMLSVAAHPLAEDAIQTALALAQATSKTRRNVDDIVVAVRAQKSQVMLQLLAAYAHSLAGRDALYLFTAWQRDTEPTAAMARGHLQRLLEANLSGTQPSA